MLMSSLEVDRPALTGELMILAGPVCSAMTHVNADVDQSRLRNALMSSAAWVGRAAKGYATRAEEVIGRRIDGA
jgi:hypothetical protein